MSGVYFQGMKMPEACNVCPAHHFYFPPTFFHDAEVTTTAVAVCMALGKEIPNLSAENRKPDWCPAIPVPGHGRLIDADALKNLVFEELNDAITDGNSTPYGEALCTFIAKNIVSEIEAAPTIIPADKEAEDSGT